MTTKEENRLLDYLPAIFSEDAAIREFLTPYEDILRGFWDALTHIDAGVDPAQANSGALPWLASWVALALDNEWPEEKSRELIARAISLYRIRGTVAGLKEYLNLYAGLTTEIRERRWPSGMQIGVASRIGVMTPAHSHPEPSSSIDHDSETLRDYYVLDTAAPLPDDDVTLPEDVQDGQPVRVYYSVESIKSVEVVPPSVTLVKHANPSASVVYGNARITRRDALAVNRYRWKVGMPPDQIEVEFEGDSVLDDDVERLHGFIVDVRVPADRLADVKANKVRAIVEQEKPAHTEYYLKLTPIVHRTAVAGMQIGLRSTIEVDTTVVAHR